MGKRHTIVNRKTDGDKARGVMYAKMSKLIEIAAKK
jgi:transcriptional/translational regulatory protein YebC/TACO1